MKLHAALMLIVMGLTASLAGAAATQELRLTYVVEVAVPSVEAARSFATEGYDVAGMDVKTMTVLLVVTPDELKRVQAKGWQVTVRSSNHDLHAIDALADYTDPQELSALMDQAVANYPNLAKKLTTQGTLFEGQKQYALLITKDVATANDRPSFILDAQHHAREVMTQEIARDMIDYLTSRYATDPQVQRWVDNVNIYVVPSVNPDGSMYVFQHDVNWRRNRHPGCPVDGNRNYPAFWGSCNGSDSDCTSDLNRGAAPASEPETQGIIQLTSSVRPFFTLSYHSCGELLMYPYGCNDPDERSAFDEVAQGLNAILQNDAGVTGQFRTGPIWSTIYLVDGGSIDTQYNRYGAYGYTIEVSSCATGGFQPDYATWRDVTVQRQRTAWSYFLDKTLDGPQIRGTVTDVATGLPLPANLDQEEVTFTHGEVQRRADDKGHYHLLTPSTRTRHVTYSYPGYCPVTQSVFVESGPVTVDAALAARPAVPQGVAAQSAGDNAIALLWQPVANAVQYRVFRSFTSGGPYTAVATLPGTQTSFLDTPVSGSIAHYYVVRSIQGCESGDSAEVSAITSGACTIGPVFSGAAIAQNAATSTCSVNLSWPGATTRCGGAITYQVYRGTTASFVPSPATLVASGLTGNTFSDHAALTSGATYYYIVRAVDAGNALDDGNGAALSASPNANTVSTWTDDAGDTGLAKMIAGTPWHVSLNGGYTGPRVYTTGAYTNNACIALATPPITLDVGATLSFASKFDMEANYDFGAVEIATGPLFMTWTYLPMNNYPFALSHWGNACVAGGDDFTHPYMAFSGSHNPPTYSFPYSAALNAYAGQSIKLRWHFSSDYSNTGQGWWIDDVAITNVVFPVACTAGAAANPKEASPDGHMTAARAASGTAVDLSYTPGCGTLDNAVYWGNGPIDGSVVWTHAACALGNTGSSSFDPGDPPPDGLIYFVIVGQNGLKEGSYGAGTAGERPEAIGVGACDKPQDLTGSCP